MPDYFIHLERRLRALDKNAFLLRIVALVALISVPFKHLSHRADDIIPVNIARLSPYTSLVIGISLLYVAGQLARKKTSAYWLSVIGLLGLVIAELLHVRNPLQIALYSATLTSIIKDRRRYVVHSDVVSIRRAVVTAAGLLGAFILFVIAVLAVVDKRDYGADLSAAATANLLVHAALGLGLPSNIHHVTHIGLRLVSLLHIAAISSLLLIGYSLFEPLKLRRPASRYQRRQARALLRNFSTSTEDYFKLWPEDKHYFFYGKSFVAYTVNKGNALVLNGASGKPSDMHRLRGTFQNYCRQNGWSIVIIAANSDEAQAWQALGLQSLFVGSEAIVDIPAFSANTTKNKHFRYVRNKAAKQTLTFEVWEPPLSQSQLHQLKIVSDAWLAQGNRREYRFVMGYFDAKYLQQCRVGVLQQDGRVSAYANLLPSFIAGGESIDHMRSLPTLPSIGMHYLLMELILDCFGRGSTTFNLGLAPLSKLDRQDAGLTEKLLGIVKTFGSRYYSFGGLEQFKGKFQPDWQPRYLLYEGGPARLPSVVSSLGAVSTYRTGQRLQNRWLLMAAAVGGAAYAAFPLAFLLNRHYAWRGLVSQLGGLGQPYAWLFNSLDVASSVIAIAIFGLLLQRRPTGLLKITLILAVLAAGGDLLSACLPLPASLDTASSIPISTVLSHPRILLHGAASFINSGAFVGSAIVWAVWWGRRWDTYRNWRTVVVASICLIVSVGTLTGLLWPPAAASLQRVFIVLYAVWMVGLTRDSLHSRPLTVQQPAEPQTPAPS